MADGKEIKAKIVFDTSGASGISSGEDKEIAKKTEKALSRISNIIAGGKFSAFLESIIGMNPLYAAGGIVAGATASTAVAGFEEGVKESTETIDENDDAFEELSKATENLNENVLDAGEKLTDLGDDARDLKSPIYTLGKWFGEAVTAIDRFVNAAKTASDKLGQVSTTQQSPVYRNPQTAPPIETPMTNILQSVSSTNLGRTNPLTPVSTARLDIINSIINTSLGSDGTNKFQP